MGTELTKGEERIVAQTQQDLDQRLGQLAQIATDAHHRATAAAATAVEQALVAGRALLEANDLCKHGTWLKWLAVNFKPGKRTAQCYMKAAKEWQAIAAKTPDATELSLRRIVKILSHVAPRGAESSSYAVLPQDEGITGDPVASEAVGIDSADAPWDVDGKRPANDREAVRMMVNLFERLIDMLWYIVRHGQRDMSDGKMILNALQRLRPEIEEFEAAMRLSLGR